MAVDDRMFRRVRSSVPGVEQEDVPPTGSEARRLAIYRDGTYAGEVVYVGRRRKARGAEVAASSTGSVTDWGWRPDGWRYAANAKLTDLAGAVERLRSVT